MSKYNYFDPKDAEPKSRWVTIDNGQRRIRFNKQCAIDWGIKANWYVHLIELDGSWYFAFTETAEEYGRILRNNGDGHGSLAVMSRGLAEKLVQLAKAKKDETFLLFLQDTQGQWRGQRLVEIVLIPQPPKKRVMT